MSLSQLPDQPRARLPAHLGTSLHANTNRRRSQPYCEVYIATTKIATRIENTRDHNTGSNHVVFGNLTNTRFSSCKSLIGRISHLKKMMLVLWVSRACGRLHRYYSATIGRERFASCPLIVLSMQRSLKVECIALSICTVIIDMCFPPWKPPPIKGQDMADRACTTQPPPAFFAPDFQDKCEPVAQRLN